MTLVVLSPITLIDPSSVGSVSVTSSQRVIPSLSRGDGSHGYDPCRDSTAASTSYQPTLHAWMSGAEPEAYIPPADAADY